MRMAMRIMSALSTLFFGTVILYHSALRDEFGVGLMVTLTLRLTAANTCANLAELLVVERED